MPKRITDVAEACALLSRGEIVALPTETVYGVGADAHNEQALAHLYKVKGRPLGHPMIVHIGFRDAWHAWAQDIPLWALRAAEAFWPGALTLLLEKKKSVSPWITGTYSRIALRYPSHALLRDILSRVPFAIVAPSANRFGELSPTCAQHVATGGLNISYVLDGGKCQEGVESTILGEEKGILTVYRLGAVSIEALEEALGEKISLHTHSGQTSGSLSHHYAPNKPMYVVEGEKDIADIVQQYGEEKVGLLRFRHYLFSVSKKRQIVLSHKGCLKEATQGFFSALHTLTHMPIACIVAEKFPNKWLGRALNDRLMRGSQTKRIAHV